MCVLLQGGRRTPGWSGECMCSCTCVSKTGSGEGQKKSPRKMGRMFTREWIRDGMDRGPCRRMRKEREGGSMPGTTSSGISRSGPHAGCAGERTAATWRSLLRCEKAVRRTSRETNESAKNATTQQWTGTGPRLPLPGVIDTSNMEKMSVSIGRCSMCDIEPAVWDDKESGVRPCEGCSSTLSNQIAFLSNFYIFFMFRYTSITWKILLK